jgi:hypothetical protein
MTIYGDDYADSWALMLTSSYWCEVSWMRMTDDDVEEGVHYSLLLTKLFLFDVCHGSDVEMRVISLSQRKMA